MKTRNQIYTCTVLAISAAFQYPILTHPQPASIPCHPNDTQHIPVYLTVCMSHIHDLRVVLQKELRWKRPTKYTNRLLIEQAERIRFVLRRLPSAVQSQAEPVNGFGLLWRRFFAARFLCTALKVLSPLGSGKDFFHETPLWTIHLPLPVSSEFLISPKFKNSKEITEWKH